MNENCTIHAGKKVPMCIYECEKNYPEEPVPYCDVNNM